jgi:predicted dinucleotide-binding enzyme
MHVSAEHSRPRLAVIGSGRMGEALVRILATHGGKVVWAGRDPERLQRTIDELGLLGVRPLGVRDAIDVSDVIVLALWHQHALDFVSEHRRLLQGKIIVDIANPFTEDFTDFTLPETTSAAEELAEAVPGAAVVGALKNTFWVVFDDPHFPEGESDILVTGDDQHAKERVMSVFSNLPFRVLDAGRLRNNRTIERMTLLSREIAIRYDHYPRTTWRLLGQAPAPVE